jgi:hypothetical protein
LNVEIEFDTCVELIGGLRVSELVGESPKFSDADYLFPQYQIIAELKSFEEDKIIDENIVRKASDIYEKCRKQGNAPDLGQGRFRFTTSDDFPDEFKLELLELYKKPIHGVIKKANTQIKSTKANLNLKDHTGLVILVNNGHTALTPNLAISIFREIFRRNSLSSINALIYFTTNPVSGHSSIPEDFFVWIPVQIRPEENWPTELLRRLKNAWLNRMAKITGQPVRAYNVANDLDLSEISNK